MSSQVFVKIKKPENFGIVLGIFIFFIFILIDSFTVLFDSLETQILDFHFKAKQSKLLLSDSSGQTYTQTSDKLSEDIIILGIDNRTLNEYGRWPFPRSRHAELLNALTKIQEQSERESAILLDILFNERTDNVVHDALLIDAIKRNERVVLQTIHFPDQIAGLDAEEYKERLFALISKHGEIKNIQGDTSYISPNYGFESPLQPFGRYTGGYGHASFSEDSDKIYRRVQLVAKYSLISRTTTFGDIKYANSLKDFTGNHHIAWSDKDGNHLFLQLPLNNQKIEYLEQEIRNGALADNNSELDAYPVEVYEEHFIPAVTLTLALQYFNKTLDDIEVFAGSHILIKSPQHWDVGTQSWVPYSIPHSGLFGIGKRQKVLDEIRIPIDKSGNMFLNYMGPRSSSSRDGNQTFPVRNYLAYSSRAPITDDPSEWNRTFKLGGKIILVGAFTIAMADDEKPTPLGLMFGVEMHANALNTIVMNNFITNASNRLNVTLLFVAIMFTAFITARVRRLLWPVLIILFIVLTSLFLTNIIFDYNGLLLDWATPVIALLITFISIVMYRVFIAERDKQQIRNVFGQFVAEELIDELVLSPPELGGEYVDGTVLFSDIRGFSNLSERQTSKRIVELLNQYLTVMTDNMVKEYNGTLDKYIGDAIMAFWGAPKPQDDHAVRACKSALAQLKLLKWLNPQVKRKFGEVLEIGVGINSASKENQTCTVAYMGSEGRKAYTAIGDTVNLASRLEGVNKEYRTNIIISEDTYRLIKHEKFIVRALDDIRVKGRSAPVTIYELIDYDGELKGVDIINRKV